MTTKDAKAITEAIMYAVTKMQQLANASGAWTRDTEAGIQRRVGKILEHAVEDRRATTRPR